MHDCSFNSLMLVLTLGSMTTGCGGPPGQSGSGGSATHTTSSMSTPTSTGSGGNDGGATSTTLTSDGGTAGTTESSSSSNMSGSTGTSATGGMGGAATTGNGGQGGNMPIVCELGFGNCDSDPANGCETMLDTVDNCGICGFTCDGSHLVCVPQEPVGNITALCADLSSEAFFFDQSVNDLRGWDINWKGPIGGSVTDTFKLVGAVASPGTSVPLAWNNPIPTDGSVGEIQCTISIGYPVTSCHIGHPLSETEIQLTTGWSYTPLGAVDIFACLEPSCEENIGIVTLTDDNGVHEICYLTDGGASPAQNCALIPHFNGNNGQLDLNWTIP